MSFFIRFLGMTANVPLVGDGWGEKSQLFELKKIITSTKKLINLTRCPTIAY